jgi:isopenicillin N synthase-like dioxygenase
MSVAVEAETLPTLDLRRFNGHASERARFLEDLRTAARKVGFFYLVGHGIEDDLIQDVLRVSRRFFALLEKDKLAIVLLRPDGLCRERVHRRALCGHSGCDPHLLGRRLRQSRLLRRWP